MSRNGKVIVAMSGGVDSSVAAYLLKEQGYAPVGVFMWVRRTAERDQGVEGPRGRGVEGAEPGVVPTSPPPHVPTSPLPHIPTAHRGCCSVGDSCDARAVAGRLGIPFYTLDFGADFEQIITYFVDEYARARTPNPCVVCNTRVKFGRLFAYADAVGAEFVATGHYARVETWERENVGTGDGKTALGEYVLRRARDRGKDQSYALFGIRRENLARCLFPVGELTDKAEVRRIAAELGLAVHDKAESQEICFVPDDDYAGLVRSRRPETERPGPIVDSTGRVLGTHTGIVNYTIGQRRGLGVAAGYPIYVTRLDAATNTVTVGPRDELLSAGLVAEELNWLVEPPAVSAWQPATVQIRYNHEGTAGSFRVRPDGSVEARFDVPQPAVTPGQAAVLYADDVLLGGGWIGRAIVTARD